MDRARVVQLYSEEPRNVYVPGRKHDTQFKLVPSSVNHLSVVAKMTQVGSVQQRVHCVDVNTGELVHAWLMSFEVTKPKPTLSQEVILKVNCAQQETY